MSARWFLPMIMLAFNAGVAVLMTVSSMAVKSASDRQQIAMPTEQKRMEIAEREVAILARKLRQTTDELSELKRNSPTQSRTSVEDSKALKNSGLLPPRLGLSA